MLNKMRKYQSNADYDRIRRFLQDVFLLNDRREYSWPAARFDYWYWHGIKNLGDGQINRDVFIWEDDEGAIVAVLNREAAGCAFLQVHPGQRSFALESEMIEVAESHLAVLKDKGTRKLLVWAHEHDQLRSELLVERGYTPGEWREKQWRRSLNQPFPEVQLPQRFSLRSLDSIQDVPNRSWVSWRAFNPGRADIEYEGWEWYLNIQKSPLYQQDLDIVAVGPDGRFVSAATIWYDPVTLTGYFEPVGTDPDYQQMGLGKAVMFEGMRRLKTGGALMAAVTGGSVPANALYKAVMTENYGIYVPWLKELLG